MPTVMAVPPRVVGFLRAEIALSLAVYVDDVTESALAARRAVTFAEMLASIDLTGEIVLPDELVAREEALGVIAEAAEWAARRGARATAAALRGMLDDAASGREQDRRAS